MYKKPVFFFAFIFFSLKAFATVFTVTSNADSGAGTLRDALTQAAAADSTVINYIYFNIPDTSKAGRTINLLTQLPDVCSNLTIDGTTQPGGVFGASGAKVGLFYQTPPAQTLSGINIENKHDVAIFGLFITNLTDVSVITTAYFWTGIYILNSNNIQIGEVGKGNVIVGFYYPLLTGNPGSTIDTRNISMKSNFFNIESDGQTLPADQESPVTLNNVAGQINIGGTSAEGNVLGNGLIIDQQNSLSPDDTVSAHFLIQNNNIGVDYEAKHAIPSCFGLFAGTDDPYGNSTFVITDNVIANGTGFAAISMTNIGQTITVLRNYIGTDKKRTNTFTNRGTFFYWCTGQVAIGSTNPADANYITNCNPVSIFPFTNATVNKNSFYCTVNAQPMHWADQNSGAFTWPLINILGITATSVSGTATPNSGIELFYSDKCGTCAPQTYFASTTADANGNWQYNGALSGTIIASATLGHNTSDFTQTSINTNNLQIVNVCGSGNGSITGAVPYSAQNIKWFDSAGNVAGTSPDLINVKIGKYKLVAYNGSCSDSTSYFQIQNKFQLDTSAIARVEPSCGNPTGSISGLNVINNDSGAPYIIWQDVNGKPLSYSLSLSNAPAGSYYLQVKSADSTCSQIFGPFNLKNTSGPNIDQSKAAIQSTNCGQSTGSVTGITASGTGTLSYVWWNEHQQTVGTTVDLLSQPTGTYQLEVTDQSQCGAVYTSQFTISDTNGITLNDSNEQATPASCSGDNGSITGVTATGATLFQWVNENNYPVGNTLDLLNVGPGTYTLTASNGSGCSVTSNGYTVGQVPPPQFPVYQVNTYQACSGKANGGVEVLVDTMVKKEQWVNQAGQVLGTGIGISNVPAGLYLLYVTDRNGCTILYSTYEVPALPQLTIDRGAAMVTNDKCSEGKGSITGISVSGGRQPYVYQWFDASGNAISSSQNITGLAAGVYTFTVNDETTCGIVSSSYTIINQDAILPMPQVSNLQVCSPGAALLQVKNPQSGYGYRLYSSATDTIPLEQQADGNFNIVVEGDETLYVSGFSGQCQSDRVEVKISVGLSSINIANTFTPNGDGINDYWVINGIASYPAAGVQVFTRWGQKVFDSRGYAIPFDGNYGGKKLPGGVYYYIINLNSNCNLLSGSLTIIR